MLAVKYVTIYDMEMALNEDRAIGLDKEIFRSQTCNFV